MTRHTHTHAKGMLEANDAELMLLVDENRLIAYVVRDAHDGAAHQYQGNATIAVLVLQQPATA